MITWDDFTKIEMRLGTIIATEDFANARKPAYKLTIDFGPVGIKKCSAQITALYTKEALVGRQIISVVNFPPKQIANFFSECLVLGEYNLQGEVILLQPSQQANNGCRIG
ncbi:MAG: tRNA-binding protein [Ferruginibacter sp.]|nr:tRNA-binding protein [Ferruginibacter sp.]